MSAVGVFVLALILGLVVDGGAMYVEKRKVQNTTDNSALAGAYAICAGHDVLGTIRSLAADNGYNNDLITNTVTVNHPPSDLALYEGSMDYVEVIISSTVPTTIMRLIQQYEVTVSAQAVGYCTFGVGGGSGSMPTGMPPEPFTIYGGAHSCSSPTIDISGNEQEALGPIHANDDWKIGGNDNDLGDVTYAGSGDNGGTGNEYDSGPDDNDTQYDWPLTHQTLDISEYAPGGSYAVAADAEGKYHTASKFDFSGGTVLDGIYYATDEIVLGADNISGTATLVVKGEGKVSFSGNHHNIEPYVNHVLIIAEGKGCSDDAINFNGNGHTWKGIVYSPNGMIQFSGNESTTLDGCLWGASVKVNGNNAIIGNCEDYIEGTTTNIYLAE